MTLISSFVMSKLDYCNVALTGLPSCDLIVCSPLSVLQSIINAAAQPHHCAPCVCTCFGILRQIRSIRRSIPRSTLSMLISSFVMSKLDYCNVALAGLPSCDLDRLQSVINAAACLTVGAQRHDHITPLLADLHWLCIPQCIQYKLCILVYQCIHGSAPSYLQNAICQVASAVSPEQRTTTGDRTFAFTGSRTWNSLPDAIRRSPLLATFKRSLKTYFHVQCFY